MAKKISLLDIEKEIIVNSPELSKSIKITEYKGTNEIIVKDKYGLLRTTANHLRRGHKPSIRTALNPTKYCVNQFKEVHGDKYDYSKVNYEKDNKKVKIICDNHGEFEQTPNDHKNMKGCRKCCFERRKGLYNLKNLNKNKQWNNKLSNIYILRLYNETENFLKIGISKNVDERIKQIERSSNRNYVIQKEKSFIVTLKEAIEFESKVLSNKECFIPYIPKNKFQGYTECFTRLKNRFVNE